MAKLKARELLRLCEQHGESAVLSQLKESVDTSKVSLADYSIRDLALTFLGESWSNRFKQQALGGSGGFSLEEGGQEVRNSLFSNITGQLIFAEIRKQFAPERYVFSNLVPTIQTPFDGTETVPSITNIGDTSELVGEGQEYPSVGIGEEYFTIPAKVKRGHKLEVTEEAIYFDRTGKLVEAAAKVGEYLALKKEKDLIDVFTGQTNNYIRNGTATNTYLTAGAYVNNASGVQLQNWTDIEAAELLFADMLDPTTGEPLSELPAGESQMIVMPHLVHTAKQILGATEIRNTAATNANFLTANSVTPYGLVSSKLLYQRVLDTIEATPGTAQAIWWLGSIQRLLAWYENWPLAVFRQDSSSNAGFERDISMRFKARYRGVAAVREPRWMVRMENVAV